MSEAVYDASFAISTILIARMLGHPRRNTPFSQCPLLWTAVAFWLLPYTWSEKSERSCDRRFAYRLLVGGMREDVVNELVIRKWMLSNMDRKNWDSFVSK